MSKLGTLRQYRYSPAAGDLFGFLGKAVKGVVSFVKGGIKSIGKSKTAQVLAETALPAAKKALPALAAGAGAGAIASLTSGGGGGGASGGWGSRRRGRGITARELRGFRKVSNLLHKEGMVSRRAHRGRSH